MSEVHYQPRVGSVCYRVFELIEANGPMAEKELAVAVDVDVSTLRSSTNLPCTNRAMVREAQGGELWYRSTRVRPVPVVSPAAAAVLEAAAPPAQKSSEADLPPATAGDTPAPVETVVNIINEVSATPSLSGEKVSAAMDDIAKTFRKEVGATIGDIGKTFRKEPRSTICPTVTAEDDPAELLPVAVASGEPRHFAFALWSDGRLSLEIDGISHTLNLQETRKLFDYLDRMRVEDEGARG